MSAVAIGLWVYANTPLVMLTLLAIVISSSSSSGPRIAGTVRPVPRCLAAAVACTVEFDESQGTMATICASPPTLTVPPPAWKSSRALLKAFSAVAPRSLSSPLRATIEPMKITLSLALSPG